MTEKAKKAIEKIGDLPAEEQEEIAGLILEELDWDQTFEATQKQLSAFAKEATKEYKSGNTNTKGW